LRKTPIRCRPATAATSFRWRARNAIISAPSRKSATAPRAGEIETVVNYLALNLGPGANLPPAKPVKLPDGHGKDLVETRCGLCHDLERVAAIKRRSKAWPVIVANMVERGATATPDEAKTITDYLAANFGN
jgi:cytochrome c5